ncbi:MAG: hypothetical protein AAF219_07080 [Myxococcota bacterium]
MDDYATGEDRRLVSVVRNLHAGVLLLFKEKLRRLSPAGSNDVFLKENVVAARVDGVPTLVGDGEKTVGIHKIKSHFKNLDVEVQWQPFNEFSRIRNQIEHYFTRNSRDVVRAAIESAAVIIRDFVVRELEIDPGELLGAPAWNCMLKIESVYEQERTECLDDLNKLRWSLGALEGVQRYLRCTSCGSALVVRDGSEDVRAESSGLRCRSCAEESSVEDQLPDVLKDHFAWDTYLAHSDGDSFPLAHCPDCFRETFVVFEDCCASCGYEAQHQTCIRCGDEIELELEQEGSLCGYCQHMADRVMAS